MIPINESANSATENFLYFFLKIAIKREIISKVIKMTSINGYLLIIDNSAQFIFSF